MRGQLACLLLALVLLVCFAACGAAVSAVPAEELLRLGEQYLLELDYEQALAQFLKVVELEPMNPRGYTGAAEAYVGLGDVDSAIAVLTEGLEVTADPEIERMLGRYGGADAVDNDAGEPSAVDEAAVENEEAMPPEFELGENITGAEPLQLQDLADWGFPHGLRERVIDLEKRNQVLAIHYEDGQGQVGTVNSGSYWPDSPAISTAPRGIRIGDHIHDVMTTFCVQNQDAMDIVQSFDYDRLWDLVQMDDYAHYDPTYGHGLPVYNVVDSDVVAVAALYISRATGGDPPEHFSLRYSILQPDENPMVDFTCLFTNEGTLQHFTVSYNY